MFKILFSASMAAFALGMSGPTFAAEGFTLNGTVVYTAQVDPLQARCDKAFAAEPPGASGGIGAGTMQNSRSESLTTPDSGSDSDVDFGTLDQAAVTAGACRAAGVIPSAAS